MGATELKPDKMTHTGSGRRSSIGVSGLDEVLLGGLIPSRAYLVRGGPGTGKTTLGLHFLAAGASQGEKNSLFITLGEPEEVIRANAQDMGLDLSGTVFLDLSPTPAFFTQIQTYDIFSPAEVEREPTTQKIVEQIEVLKPQRVFIDSMTQFRYLASDTFQFRKQVLSFLRFLMEQGTTVLFSSEGSVASPDDDLQFMSDGVINLDSDPADRTVWVSKFRGSDFITGKHSMKLTNHGMKVFARLVPGVYQREFKLEPISSGIPELNELLHGGLERGTVTIIRGPSGVGKTSLGLQFMKEAAGRGERSVVYLFEEELDILLQRCDATGTPARAMIERGTLNVEKIEPLQYSADEFAQKVRAEVENLGARIVMLDSIAGYRLSLFGEDLVSNLHALCKYLQSAGVAVLIISEVRSMAGAMEPTGAGISYLADNILFMRYMECHTGDGFVELRKTIGVLKKRLSSFEKTLREIEMTKYGIKVGEPMPGLSGIISETPIISGCRKEG